MDKWENVGFDGNGKYYAHLKNGETIEISSFDYARFIYERD